MGAAIAWVIGMGIGSFLNDSNVKKPRDQKSRQKLRDKVISAMDKPNKSKKLEESLAETMEDISNQYDQMLDATLETAYAVVTLNKFEK